MSDPVVTVMEEVNGVTLQLLEDSHVGFPTAMSTDVSDWEFYLWKFVVRPSAPVHPSALLPAPVCSSAHPPTRPLIRSEPSSACVPVRPPVRSSARSPHPPVRPSAHSSACPPTPSAPSALFHPWSLAYKFLVVEAERAPSV